MEAQEGVKGVATALYCFYYYSLYAVHSVFLKSTMHWFDDSTCIFVFTKENSPGGLLHEELA